MERESIARYIVEHAGDIATALGAVVAALAVRRGRKRPARESDPPADGGVARVRLDRDTMQRLHDDIAALRADLAALRREFAEYRMFCDADRGSIRRDVREDVTNLRKAIADNESDITELRRTVELGVDRTGGRAPRPGDRK